MLFVFSSVDFFDLILEYFYCDNYFIYISVLFLGNNVIFNLYINLLIFLFISFEKKTNFKCIC